jgi:signal transduction histidine kinase
MPAMQMVLALPEGRFRRAVNALLHYEPKILDGLTWSHFGYVGLLAIGFAVIRAAGSRFDPPALVAWNWIPLSSICGLMVLLCTAVLTNIKLQRIPRPVILGIAVIAGCTLALQLHLWLWVQHPVPFGYSIHKFRIILLQWGMVAAAYYFIERSARRAAELREAQLERHRIEAQMLEARLQMMQAQVEPHFLFNTLAHVQRLYETDSARGRSMLDSFCDYLRAALPQMRGNRSTLGREVELARAYLNTQRIRMGRRLRFEIAIPQELLPAVFPPMMLLSLVENAIKHGLNPLRGGGIIRIVAASGEDVLGVTVTDTGTGLSTAEYSGGDGVGLSNIRSRLAALYRGRARLTLRGNIPHGVVAAIDVPLCIDEDGARDDERAQASQAAPGSHPLGAAA